MTNLQIAALRAITNRIERFPHDGSMSYRVEPIEGTDRLLFQASNADGDLKWFERHESVTAVIGPRGGFLRPTVTGFSSTDFLRG